MDDQPGLVLQVVTEALTNGDIASARAAVQTVLRISPQDPAALLAAISVELEAGEQDRVHQMVGQLVAKGGAVGTWARLFSGEAYLRAHALTAAERIGRSLIEESLHVEVIARAHLLLGRVSQAQGLVISAMHHFALAEDCPATRLAARIGRGEELAKVARTETEIAEAVGLLKSAWGERKHDPELGLAYAEALTRLRYHRYAEDVTRAALSLANDKTSQEPQNGQAWTCAGILCERIGRDDLARKCYTLAIKTTSWWRFTAAEKLSAIAVRADEYPDAIVLLRAYLAFAPADHIAQRRLAIAHLLNGDREQAEVARQIAIALTPVDA